MDPQEEAKRILAEKEKSSGLEFDQTNEVKVNPESGRPTLGIADKTIQQQEKVEEIRKLSAEIGWIEVPVAMLPSGGLFYPDRAEIAIKAASVMEIRHFSTMDETNAFDIDEKINFVIDKCLKIRFDGAIASWKDLKDEDRFFILFSIRDLTFKNGENKLTVNLTCKGCSTEYKEELKNGSFDYYKIKGKMMEYFNAQEKCFVIQSQKAGNFKLYVPSLGITTFIKSYLEKKQGRGEKYDKSFVKVAPFLFGDWRFLNDASYQKAEQDSWGWDPTKFSAISKLTEMIRFGVKLSITKKCSCGEEVTAPLSFPGGVKSLFIISEENIFDIL
jgi:hypothetical protein